MFINHYNCGRKVVQTQFSSLSLEVKSKTSAALQAFTFDGNFWGILKQM